MPPRNLVTVEDRPWALERDGLRDAIVLGVAVVAIVLVGLGGWAALAHVDGAVPVPTGPGMGVDIDEAKIERYRVETNDA